MHSGIAARRAGRRNMLTVILWLNRRTIGGGDAAEENGLSGRKYRTSAGDIWRNITH